MKRSELAERILMRYGHGLPGPLVIVMTGVHGNEHAGVEAMTHLHKMLVSEPVVNPGFQLQGELIGILGNLAAIERHERYIDRDLNRMWTPEEIDAARRMEPFWVWSEQEDLLALDRLIRHLVREHRGGPVYMIDLHTTSAAGGIFTIVPDDEELTQIAQGMYAPVITGFMAGLAGTSIGYFNGEIEGKQMHCLAFEAGQHTSPRSVEVSISGVVNFLRSIGVVKREDVENQHDEVLRSWSEGLPSRAGLLYAHKIPEGSAFEMLPGFSNFQPVKKGTPLAIQDGVTLFPPQDGLILMPRYQPRGQDGFFIIEY